jgi:spoIIIJ-associated protein
VLEEILRLCGLEVTVERKDEPERIVLALEGADAGLVIGKQGATLDALQFLANKIVYKDAPGQTPIVVDAEGYRGRRAENLAVLARRLAEDAVRTRRRIEMAPMSASDRRIVHVTLAEIPGVSTQSEGEGLNRRVVIIPGEGHDLNDDEAL